MVQGLDAPVGKRDAVQALAKTVGFDPSGVLRVLDVREGKAGRSKFDVADVFARYLAALEQVTASVDKMLDSGGTGPL
jgi:hypothetical protein